MTPILLVDAAAAAAEPQAHAALAARLAARGAAMALVAGPPGHRVLLLAAQGHDLGRSWLATADPAWLTAAATAGLAGLALIGADPPVHATLITARCDGLADAPRVMVPRGGGCWHDQQG